MKRKILSCVITLLPLITLLSLSHPCHAAVFESGDLVTLTSRTSDDLYMTGRVIRVEQQIKGDFVAAAGIIEINADIQGDVIAAGGNIIINGNVSDDVRVAGGNVEINGKVQDDLIAAGGKIIIGPNASIDGDIRVWATDLVVQGNVKGKISGTVGVLDIQGKVNGDVEITVDQNLNISKQGFISGNLNYSSWKPLGIPRERIGGELIYSKIAKEKPQHIREKVQENIIVILSFLVLGIVLIKLTPKYRQNLLATCKENFWRNLFVGIAWLIFAPILAILLCVTIIGIPLAIALISLYIIIAVAAYAVTAYWIGSSIYKPVNETMWAKVGKLLLGLIIVSLLWHIPIVGWLIVLAIFTASIGAMLSTPREKTLKQKAEKKKKK